MPVKVKGWCWKHYQRNRRNGHLDLLVYGSVESYFWDNVRETDTCWLWLGSRHAAGYGTLRTPYCGTGLAHRVSWSWANMCPMPPPRLKIDHICHNPPCVNPEHLRLVTNKQNAENLSGVGARNTSGYRGVSKGWREGLWLARVVDNGVVHHVGYFTDVHQAGEAARLKRLKLFTYNELDKADR